MNNKISEEKLDKYLKLTKEALDAVEQAEKNTQRIEEANDFLNISRCYYSDALHFKKQGEILLAFTAVNYSHAFLDAGARIGLFKVNDSRLFMVDDGQKQ